MEYFVPTTLFLSFVLFFPQSFLSSRSFEVSLGTTLSDYDGVPQGSVRSSTFFLVALNGPPSSLPTGVCSTICVEDLALLRGDDLSSDLYFEAISFLRQQL